ncbi:retrograde regulation protein 2 [Trichodelitschia bisporula]|uniref:Retrograde regulation protein 2 n=1 Tax=Trichodelitschia bisporula TaxID=703511 RepID=A0A6G1I243_9PEZI|nr:retrograde regulation protein 2 [Trichodelitschia bisporula]
MAPQNPNYVAIVDMGSNGIRYSITDLAPATARIMPSIYQDRAGISLYDAQWAGGVKVPIPDTTISAVIAVLQRFQRTCAAFGVPASNVRVLATEATRQAANSEAFRERIKEATGWTVEMLPKEEEGVVGALGVASSFFTARGLMMDLGGGSTQLTWISARHGEMEMSARGAVSLPYGAAALTRRLEEAHSQGRAAVSTLREEITGALKEAVAAIAIPPTIEADIKSEQGLTLYLSGGGFRGWGFILMSARSPPYPIHIINGFRAPVADFHSTDVVSSIAATDDKLFRVSERRAGQVPAVALLVECLEKALPAIKTVAFAQGGVREGVLFRGLSTATRATHPLVTVTRAHAPPSVDVLAKLLRAAAPPGESMSEYALTALANAMYIYGSLNKDVQAAACLRSTTTGLLAGVHGADHGERAAVAVMLCERRGGAGALSPDDERFMRGLMGLLGSEEGWWCVYFGRVAGVLGECYPAGVVEGDGVKVDATWEDRGESKKGKDKGMALRVTFDFTGEGVEGGLRWMGWLGRRIRWS